jgi:hypothetical protein
MSSITSLASEFHPSARTLSDYQQIGSLADPLKQIVPYLPPVRMPGNVQTTDPRIFRSYCMKVFLDFWQSIEG